MVYSVSTSENTVILHCVQDDVSTGIRGRKAHPVLVVIPEGNLRLFLLYTICESALSFLIRALLEPELHLHQIAAKGRP